MTLTDVKKTHCLGPRECSVLDEETADGRPRATGRVVTSRRVLVRWLTLNVTSPQELLDAV